MLKFIKFAAAALTLGGTIGAAIFVLRSKHAFVLHPKGVIAQSQLDLILTNISLMLLIIIPTFILLFYTLWKQSRKEAKDKYDPEHSHGAVGQWVLWGVPSIFVVVMSLITWEATHKLDPFRPLESTVKPLTIQIVALDWKWLFIYPEEGIAVVNYLQFPEQTPIHLELCSDGSPMNSFWVPQMSGQIYAMTGMATQLHWMADGPGVYQGRAAEINGKGYADMTFTAESASQNAFEAWIAKVKQSPSKLTLSCYEELAKPSLNDPVTLYSQVEQNLFREILNKHQEGEK